MNKVLKNFVVSSIAAVGVVVCSSAINAATPVPQGTKGSVTHYDSTGAAKGGVNPGNTASRASKSDGSYTAPPQTAQDTTTYDLDGDGVENIRDLCPTIKEEIEYTYNNPEYPNRKGFEGGCNGLFTTGDVNCPNNGTCYYGSMGGAGYDHFRIRVSYHNGFGINGQWAYRKDTRVECRYSNERSTAHYEDSWGCGCRPGQRMKIDPNYPFNASGSSDAERGYACGDGGDVVDYGDYGPSTPIAGKNDSKCFIGSIGFICE
mgnify:CR=1 FL=1